MRTILYGLIMLMGHTQKAGIVLNSVFCRRYQSPLDANSKYGHEYRLV